MRLSAILFLLGLKLRWSAWRDGDFRKKLSRLDRVVVIRTEDNRQARSYVFRDDTVRAVAGIHAQATAELVWSDADTAVQAMMSGNQLDSFSAIGRGDLTILGNLQDALWFSDLVS
jgi:hypothetical protein